jgi:hypothetical protein
MCGQVADSTNGLDRWSHAGFIQLYTDYDHLAWHQALRGTLHTNYAQRCIYDTSNNVWTLVNGQDGSSVEYFSVFEHSITGLY